MNMFTPPTIAEHVLDFCRFVADNSVPEYLAVEPAPHAEANDCFGAVQEMVRDRGGAICYGWQIWEWPRVMIEAEFHAVWRDTSGVLHDLTPKALPINRILFLPDPGRQYEGRQVKNVRRALVEIPEVFQFFAACDAEFEFMNRGARAEQHGQIHLMVREAQEFQVIIQRKRLAQQHLIRRLPLPGRNDSCPCGSGKKFKKCHGR